LSDLKADCKRILHRRRLGWRQGPRGTGTKSEIGIRGSRLHEELYEAMARPSPVVEDEDEAKNEGHFAPQQTDVVHLMVSTSVCGSRWPRTGLLSLVSPNQKTGSVPPSDWLDTATVKTAIGQPARVTHGYRLHQQYLRSIFAAFTTRFPLYFSSTFNVSRTRRD
jgi:hypothetical protein